MRRAGVVLAFLFTFRASVLLADTPRTVWERAADPRGAAVERVHAAIEERLARAAHPLAKQSALEDARSRLESSFAAGIDAPLLHYDLAQVYFAQKRYTLVLRELRSLLETPPDAASLVHIWDMLSMTYAHLERHEEERDAHREHLRLLRGEGTRAVATMNLAESEMSLGRLDEAILQYREAARIASESPLPSASATAVLCSWGLSVALDRSGDAAQALAEAARANALDPGAQVLTGDSVFFAPAYERDWYMGLSAEATAQSLPEAQRERYLVTAGAYFRSYVNNATAPGRHDRWVELAKKRAAKLEKLGMEATAARLKKSKSRASYGLPKLPH
jgi:tetratricopeptide (TPR) repeat protein